MKKFKHSNLFKKQLNKLKGQELINLLKKIDEIITEENTNHYKNLRYDLSKYKRAHVNDSYVILFFDKNNIIHFVDYQHHDKIYKHNKKHLKKYNKLKFD